MRFTATVRSAGADSGAFNVSSEVDDAVPGKARVAGLAAGAQADLTFTGRQAAPGAHAFRALVDPADQAREADETSDAVSFQAGARIRGGCRTPARSSCSPSPGVPCSRGGAVSAAGRSSSSSHRPPAAAGTSRAAAPPRPGRARCTR